MQHNVQKAVAMLVTKRERCLLRVVKETLSKSLLITACVGSMCVLLACAQPSKVQTAFDAGDPAATESSIPESASAPEATMLPVLETIAEEAFTQMFEYRSRDDEIQISKYLGKDADVVIPAFIGAHPVTEIEAEAFYSCDTLRSVVIPDSVTYIGDSAFEGCSGLQCVVIPEGVTRIGTYAFAQCGSLTKIELPDSLQHLGSGCFCECGALADIEVPNGVKVLNENIFGECKSLKTAMLPGNLRQFAATAFSGCNAITVIAPSESDTLRIAAGYGFKTEAKVPDTGTPQMQPILAAPASDFTYEFLDGDVVLTDYTGSEQSILLPDRIEGKPVVGIRNDAYDSEEWFPDPSGWCTPFFIEIPEGVTHIGNGTFSGNNGLRSIILPNSLTHIGERAFNACCSLTSLVIPAGVTDIGEYAFAGTEISDITIPGGVRYPGGSLFVENMRLRHILFQEGVQTIPANLCYCERLESVHIPTTVTSIGEAAFRGSFSLQELAIPDGLTSIGAYAFENCDLTGLILPSSIETVGAGAFVDTPFFESVAPVGDWIILGDGLVHIYAGKEERVVVPKEYRNVDFYSVFCASGEACPVEEIVLEEGTSFITDGAFFGCDALREITIPDSVTDIGNNAFCGCSALTSITIPNSVTSIGVNAFGGEWTSSPDIRCQAGSYAETYAKQNNLQYVLF